MRQRRLHAGNLQQRLDLEHQYGILRQPRERRQQLVSLQPRLLVMEPRVLTVGRFKSGSLGNSCSLDGASAHSCSGGVCRATACVPGCGLYSGTCKDLNNDAANW